MLMYGKNHYNIVIRLQLIKINEKKRFFSPLYIYTTSSLYIHLLMKT